MQPRATILLRLLCLSAICVFAQTAFAQIRSLPHASEPAAAHPQDHSPVELDLCVRGGTNADQCPPPGTQFNAFVPQITYTYGQLLDGVAYIPLTSKNGYGTLTANGVVFCTLPAFPVTSCPANSTNFDPGTYILLLVYTNPDDGTTITGSPVTVTVLQDVTSYFMLTSSLNPAPVGMLVTFTATALGSLNEPATGAVAFADGTNLIGSGTLDQNGMAQFTTSSLAVGRHTIVASYPGSVDLSPPPDAMLTQVIIPPMTTATLTSSVNPSVVGQNVTFTASVSSTTPGLHPAGAVSFNDGTKTFATVLVSPQGIASTSISTLASGTHNITANYSGDAATGPSVSNIVVQQVTYPLTPAGYGFTVSVTPAPVVLGTGLTANLTVTVNARSGFSEPVTLTCADLPHESTCTFGETVIPAGGGSTTLDLHVMSPHDCGSTTPYFYGAARPGSGIVRYGGPALAAVLLLLVPRRRRWRNGLLALCACFSLAGLGGCSSACTDFGTYPGSYTFKVIGTAPAGTGGALAGSGTTLVVPTSVGLTVKI